MHLLIISQSGRMPLWRKKLPVFLDKNLFFLIENKIFFCSKASKAQDCRRFGRGSGVELRAIILERRRRRSQGAGDVKTQRRQGRRAAAARTGHPRRRKDTLRAIARHQLGI